MNAPFLSFIVPIYQSAPYLEKCLLSILNQGVNEQIELICINDGSTDESAAIVKEIQKTFSNIRLIEQSNAGLGVTRNRGIQLAQGKYLFFVDSDDWIEEAALPKLLEILREREPEMLEFLTQLYEEESGRISAYNSFKNPAHKGLDGASYLKQQDQLLLTACSRIWKREFVLAQHLHFSENKLFEDVDFALRAYYHVQQISNCDLVVYNYRIRKDSLTHSYRHPGFLSDFYTERLKKHIAYKKRYSDPAIRNMYSKAISKILIKSYFVLISRGSFFKDFNYWILSFYYSMLYFSFIFRHLVHLSGMKLMKNS